MLQQLEQILEFVKILKNTQIDIVSYCNYMQICYILLNYKQYAIL